MTKAQGLVLNYVQARRCVLAEQYNFSCYDASIIVEYSICATHELWSAATYSESGTLPPLRDATCSIFCKSWSLDNNRQLPLCENMLLVSAV